ncbi:MAG: TraR/DksA C4-type zinc finger protein [Candidatus Yanofskybacteria bacterium]|nr:TraR/DksA C4-type zinc finger protein [Candidatus Yanofskybacteria bacterium]
MTKEELEKLDKELALEEESLTKQLEGVASENPAVPGDFEPTMPKNTDYEDDDDSLNASTELNTDIALEHELEKRLEQIKLARERIKNQAYGVCSNCKNPIPEERLKAMPTAAFCINCASVRG